MKYFKAYELVDRETFLRLGNDSFTLFDKDALQALDDLREFFGVGVAVNNWYWHTDIPEEQWEEKGIFQWRGWRTLVKARKLGAPRSAHARGKAFDCDIKGVTAEDARSRIIANKNHPLLCRITRMESGVSWVHFDVIELHGVERIYLFKA